MRNYARERNCSLEMPYLTGMRSGRVAVPFSSCHDFSGALPGKITKLTRLERGAD